MVNELDQITNELKEQVRTQVKNHIGHRPPYLVPLTKFTKSDQNLKLITVGRGLGLQIPKDVCYAMGLIKGKILRVHLELHPQDATRHLEE